MTDSGAVADSRAQGDSPARAAAPDNPTVLERLEALNEGAKRPTHGENTYEEKVAWDLANEAEWELGRRLEDALPDLLAVAKAAERAFILTYDPKRTDAENDELQRRAAALTEALGPLLREAEA